MSATILDVDDLLAPIAGANAAGVDLRYEPVYDRIRSARKAAEERPRDAALWNALADTISGVLRTESKDLQLAVWLAETMARQDGFRGIAPGLNFVRRLLCDYWDRLYPLIEPEDDEPLAFRESVLDWLDGRLADFIQGVPLTNRQTAYGVIHHEMMQSASADKKAKLIENGYPSAEAFDAELDATDARFVDATLQAVNEGLLALDQFEAVCQDLFTRPIEGARGRARTSVSVGKVRRALETGRHLLERTKRRRGPAPAPSEPAPPPTSIDVTEVPSPPAVSAPVHIAGADIDRDGVVKQLRSLSAFLREDNARSPLPYLLTRALAFSQLFACESLAAAHPLPAPATATRQRLRMLLAEENWSDLLDESERAMGSIDKQAWMDLQRYSIVAMESLGGYERALEVARGALIGLLKVFPDIGTSELDDGTAAAGRETIDWLRSIRRQLDSSSSAGAASPLAPVQPLGQVEGAREVQAAPDDWEAATALVRAGNIGDAVALLQLRVQTAGSGREHFISKLRLAELCLQAGNAALAFPLLDELARAADDRRLDQWEDRALLVRVWTSLYRCCRQLGNDDPELKARGKDAFGRLCRMDPTQAIVEQQSSPSRWFTR